MTFNFINAEQSHFSEWQFDALVDVCQDNIHEGLIHTIAMNIEMQKHAIISKPTLMPVRVAAGFKTYARL